MPVLSLDRDRGLLGSQNARVAPGELLVFSITVKDTPRFLRPLAPGFGSSGFSQSDNQPLAMHRVALARVRPFPEDPYDGFGVWIGNRGGHKTGPLHP